MTELTYSLTFLQRFFNPRGVFIYRALQVIALIPVFLIFIVDNINTKFDIIISFVCLLMVIFLYNCIMGRFTKSGGLFWQQRNTPCYVAVKDGLIIFTNGIVRGGFELKHAKVLKGLFKVNSVSSRFGEYTVIIPENAVSFSELKKIVEMNRTPDPAQHEEEK